jgi:uncharacterized protein HemY
VSAPKKAAKKAGKKAVAREAAEAAEADPATYSDHLIDEVAAELGEDAPVMLGLHQITKRRRLRAKLARQIEDIDPLMRRLDAAERAGVLDKQHADTFELMADIEDFLREFAADRDEFDEWVDTRDETTADRQLVALLASFARGLHPGKALSSST